MSIQRDILLRHREDGYLRFSVPAAVTAPDLGPRLVAALRAVEGIYRVDLFPRQHKLAIRYHDTVVGFGDVVRRLYALIGELAAKATTRATAAPASGPAPTLPAVSGAGRWLAAKIEEVRETAAAVGVLMRRGFAALGNRPRWMQDFATDLLMLFLIKLHWHHITTLWLPHPWTYRYEWMATFYLIYLQVQSRLPKPV